ncbi:hypothetical protein TNCV_1565751 [Trichonephila clavipes]|nr:hypothetical protein TNCV_1565751 [Trichonephila clavipes]
MDSETTSRQREKSLTVETFCHYQRLQRSISPTATTVTTRVMCLNSVVGTTTLKLKQPAPKSYSCADSTSSLKGPETGHGTLILDQKRIE